MNVAIVTAHDRWFREPWVQHPGVVTKRNEENLMGRLRRQADRNQTWRQAADQVGLVRHVSRPA